VAKSRKKPSVAETVAEAEELAQDAVEAVKDKLADPARKDR
jgi:predicted RNase H-like HicB family nuclease